ncbi:MAG: aldose 1-epimerase [Thermoleophilaceae bacterium]
MKLASRESRVEAQVAPEVGMVCCSLRHGADELLGQRGGLKKYAESGSTMGIPFLYPWANRLRGFEYEAAGRRVELDPDSPLVRKDPNGLPIHGLLAASPYWEVSARSADGDGAKLAARLDFAAHDELMAAFPFPHAVEMEVTLRGSGLVIATTVTPTGDVPVPVSFGFHPYLQLPGTPRPEWQIAVPVRRHIEVDERKIPTGRTKPVRIEAGPLGERSFDDGYSELDRPARFALWGGGRRLVVEFVRGYDFAQLFAPPDQELIAFEPMTAPTNALVSGDGLRFVEPGRAFTATFMVAIDSAR